MTRAFALLGRAIGLAVLAAQVAGALLVALVLAVEAADEPLTSLARTVAARLPSLWAQAAAVLVVCGVAVAVARLRRRGVLLGLGTLGVSPRLVLLVGALAGAAVGRASGAVATEPVALSGDWERGDGGWIRGGQGWPDAVGDVVRPRAPLVRSVAADMVNGSAAGALGAALGLYVGAAPTLVAGALLLIVDVVARGLVDRGAVPAIGGFAPGGMACALVLMVSLRAPLFPRRWGGVG